MKLNTNICYKSKFRNPINYRSYKGSKFSEKVFEVNTKQFWETKWNVRHLLELEKNRIWWSSSENKNSISEINQLVLDSQQALADAAGIKIINSIDNKISLKADKDSFTTIFSNLINNAIKYFKNGGLVQIEAIENTNAIIISISDNGVGIEKYLDKVFNRFYRMSKARANSKGTGLG